MRMFCLFFLATAGVAFAQTDWVPGSQKDGGVSLEHQKDGGVSEVLQSIYIPAIPDAPFSATLHTEWVRPMRGSGTITLVNRRIVLRDRDGRLLEERCALTPKQDEEKSILSLLQLYDPNQHTGYDCFVLGPRHGTCELHGFFPSEPHDVPVKNGPILGGLGFQVHDDLGNRVIEGILTTGSRDITIWNAGAIGNDGPLSITREFWHSAQLGINLISILDDPRIGRQTFTLTDISLEDVDPKYFQLPAGYVVEDRRAPRSATSPAN